MRDYDTMYKESLSNPTGKDYKTIEQEAIRDQGYWGTKPAESSAPSAAAPAAPAAPAGPKVPKGKSWSSYETPEMSTAYNIEKYTSEDSPLMVQAQTTAKQAQNASGLLNSQGTIAAVQNNMYNQAVPMASADTSNAINIGLTKMNDDLQRDLASAEISSAERIAASKIFGDLANTELASMGRIMSTPGATWTQTFQDDFENAINAAKQWTAGLFSIPLA